MALGSNTGKYLGLTQMKAASAPGITCFHCLKASTDGGGASILVDGFHAAASDSCGYAVRDDYEGPYFFCTRLCRKNHFDVQRRIISLDIDGDVEGNRFYRPDSSASPAATLSWGDLPGDAKRSGTSSTTMS